MLGNPGNPASLHFPGSAVLLSIFEARAGALRTLPCLDWEPHNESENKGTPFLI
jgi:hypothetical protein